ncbi:MAG: hypothetical protein LQ344_000864 [Seirophora lacunosa]|nr:MAG: hypothetical protein LQ344_000864 [Seirophora lacunosa]
MANPLELRMALEYSTCIPYENKLHLKSLLVDGIIDIPKGRLRNALCSGGVDPQTIEVTFVSTTDFNHYYAQKPGQILVRGDQTSDATQTDEIGLNGGGDRHLPYGQSWDPEEGMDLVSPKGPENAFDFSRVASDAARRSKKDQDYHLHCSNGTGNDDIYFPDDGVNLGNFPSPSPKTDRLPYSKMNRIDQRSIIVKNLSPKTTHQDIVSICRGGPLLDVYLRSHDKSAVVTFVHGSAAQEFFSHVKRKDVYIHSRRLSFAWCDRQYVLPTHVASKIVSGATRNLVIHGVHPNITEKLLRDDLEHIHNLVVISVTFSGADAYLSLNSIRNSLFARTCMMSRAKYKSMRIEWYPDECALPLPKVEGETKKGNAAPTRLKEAPIANRFQMLNMDDGEDDATEAGSYLVEDDDPTTTSEFSSPQAARRSLWNQPIAAA